MTRRDYLELMAAGAAATAAARTLTAAGGEADREARMKWWHEARFGMFIHWGLYSVLARHEWVMENEGASLATNPGLRILPGCTIASKGRVRSLLLVRRANHPLGTLRVVAADMASRTTLA